jgi:hypothetical protein
LLTIYNVRVKNILVDRAIPPSGYHVKGKNIAEVILIQSAPAMPKLAMPTEKIN